MVKSKNGPRSKFSMLPHQIRWRVYNLLSDGATLKALLADPEVQAALDKAGMTLNGPNLTGIRKSREYADFTQMRYKHLEAKQKDMMLTAIAQGTGTFESMTDQARVRLMEALAELSDWSGRSDWSDEDRIKAMRSLAQSVAALTNPAKDNRIADLLRKLREKEAQHQASEAAWKAREAELLGVIQGLREARKDAVGMSKETLAEVEEKIKLL